MSEFTEITDEMITNLLTHTDSLMNHIYFINQTFNLKPNKDTMEHALIMLIYKNIGRNF